MGYESHSTPAKKPNRFNKLCVAALTVTVVLLALGVLVTAAVCTVFTFELFKLKSEMVSFNQITSLQQKLDTISVRLDNGTLQVNGFSNDMLLGYSSINAVIQELQNSSNMTAERVENFETAVYRCMLLSTCSTIPPISN